jgi:carboxy-cis,cis-muconate cyclase
MIRPAVFSQASAIFTRLRTRSFSTTSSAAMKHHLMIGTWVAPGRIYTVQFDDEALTLELVKKTEIPEAEPISWMTFSHDKKTIYGAAMKKWNSFAVNSPTDIVHQVSHPVAGHRMYYTINPQSQLELTWAIAMPILH